MSLQHFSTVIQAAACIKYCIFHLLLHPLNQLQQPPRPLNIINWIAGISLWLLSINHQLLLQNVLITSISILYSIIPYTLPPKLQYSFVPQKCLCGAKINKYFVQYHWKNTYIINIKRNIKHFYPEWNLFFSHPIYVQSPDRTSSLQNHPLTLCSVRYHYGIWTWPHMR